MRRLPSGTRTSPRAPIEALNALGPALRALGKFPKVSDTRRFEKLVAPDAKCALDDWADEARLVRLQSYDDEAGLSLFGALAVRAQTLRCYKNALGFRRVFEGNPQIAEEKIERPLFVLGWPRTGTTLMHRLLTLHRRARSMPVWEGYCPLPYENGKPLTQSQRYAKAKRAMAVMNWVAPDLAAIHSMGVDDPEECFHLFRNYSAMPPGFDFAYLPSYWAWYAKQDPANAYRLHKRQLQVLQSFDRRGHWVLKAPQHMAGLPGLLKVYPDARIVFMHRDPVEAVASYCSLLAVTWGMSSDDVDLGTIAGYVLANARQSQQLARKALTTVGAEQIAHVSYSDMVRDPVAVASGLYDRLGYPHDDGLRASMRAWFAHNPKDGHGRHAYALSDFGLTEAAVRAALEPEEAGFGALKGRAAGI